MINESPEQNKKAKTSLPAQSEGPTIHELDSTDILPEELFNDDVEPLGQVFIYILFLKLCSCPLCIELDCLSESIK